MRYFLIAIFLLASPSVLAQPDPFPGVAASSYLVQVNGKLVWERNADRRFPPASLTKLMTVLLVLERGHLQDIVAISHAAQRETGSRIQLKAGERFRVQDLIVATLMASANDACHALADYVSGNQRRFVQLMNLRAHQLGLDHTHFTNACGHDAPGHYSSTRDLARLANELLKHAGVVAITSRNDARIATLNGSHKFHFHSTNALVGRYRGVLGLKTGFTPRAGRCLVAYAKRGKTQVLLVILHGNHRWWDTEDMLDVAFAHAHPPA